MHAGDSTLQLHLDGRPIRLLMQTNLRARRYHLRIVAGDAVRLTIPRGGNPKQALAFARTHTAWIVAHLDQTTATPRLIPHHWPAGTRILLRGIWHPVTTDTFDDGPVAALGEIRSRVTDGAGDLRPHLEPRLIALAARELESATRARALQLGLQPSRLTIRAQRTRWGSCSSTGTISLNWRLIHCTPAVMDYIVVHEITHLSELNHSPRFWRQVAQACPTYRESEAWLKTHRGLLLQ